MVLIRQKLVILSAILMMVSLWNCSWKSNVYKRLNQDIQPPLKTITLDQTKNYYFFSDLHRGNGGDLDYFNPNRKMFSTILHDLYTNRDESNDAVVISVGDIEELWAYGFSLVHGSSDDFELNSLLNPETDENQGIFEWERKFSKDGRYFKIYGNHDDYWAEDENVEQSLLGENNIKAYPAIAMKLNQNDEDYKILVTHGCQGQPLHDVKDYIAPIVKELELHTWYYLRRIFLKKGERLRPKQLEKTRDEFNKQEKYLAEWADEKQVYLIVGHTHDPYINGQKFDCILVREIESVQKNKLPQLKQKIRTLDDNIVRLRGREDTKSKRAFNANKEQVKREKAYLENIETELTFLQNELSRRIEQKTSAKGYEEGLQDLYFNTGCCFASNIITAIKLEYRNEAWQFQLVYWDIKEDKKILERDTLEDVRGKIKRAQLGQPVGLK